MTASGAAAEAWAAMRALVTDHDRKREACAAVGLSFVRVKALRALDGEDLTMGELASRLAADPPYVTLIAADLEERGLISRGPHPRDGRAKLLSITPAGRDVAATAERILSEPPAALSALPDDQLGELTRILGEVVERA